MAADEAEGPRGWYLAEDVGRLVGIPAQRVSAWMRHGYIRPSRSAGSPRVYSYDDVAEALAVRDLLEHGVQPSEIQRTIARLRDAFGDWPLSSAPLETVELNEGGPRVVLLHDEDGDVRLDIGGRDSGAQTWAPTLGRLHDLAGLLRRGGWAVRYHPDIEHIRVDPSRLSGKPTIDDLRLDALMVGRMGRSESGRIVLREDYDLRPKQIDDAVSWLHAVEQLQQAA